MASWFKTQLWERGQYDGDEKSRLNVLQLAIELGADYIYVELQKLPVHQRGDVASNLFFEANARMRDPVYGCVGAISYLQNQVSQLQMQLAVAQAEILCFYQLHKQFGDKCHFAHGEWELGRPTTPSHEDPHAMGPRQGSRFGGHMEPTPPSHTIILCMLR